MLLRTLLLLVLLTTPLLATKAVIDCPTRTDFEACYLTTEDPLTRNYATLLRGLEVEVIGRSENGRWKVRLNEVKTAKVIPHGSWPGDGPAEGWVNPGFLVMGNEGSAEAVLGESIFDQISEDDGIPAGAYDETNGVCTEDAANESSVEGDIGLLGMSTGTDGGNDEGGDILASVEPPADESTENTSTGTLTGSQFIAQTTSLSRPEREKAIIQAISAGHVPSFIRNFAPVSLTYTGPSGKEHKATVRVSPDYVAIGTNEDFVRMPMAAPTAQIVAEMFGCTLPRAKLVDAIWKQAKYKLRPRPLPPTSQMMSNEWYKKANELVNEEMGDRSLGPLTAGDKKDIVLTNRLLQKKDRVAIYGWHLTSGKAIQPLSTIHEASYADYSHGLRLLSTSMVVDGENRSVAEVLKDPELAGLLTHEKNVQVMRYP